MVVGSNSLPAVQQLLFPLKTKLRGTERERRLNDVVVGIDI